MTFTAYDHKDDLLIILQRHGVTDGADGWTIEPAPGGSTGRTFRAVDPGGEQSLTIRIARPGLGDWLRHEEHVLRELSSEPTCAPREVRRVKDADLPEGQMLVHPHLRGEPAPLATLSVEARERLGTCLAGIHGHDRDGFMIWPSLEVRSGTRADAWGARLSSIRQFRTSHGQIPEIEEIVGRLHQTELPESAGWHEPHFALIHGDLSLGNLLWDDDGVPTLIDWEFARDGDPAEDLAYLVAEQGLSPDLVADIAEGYIAAHGDPWAFARLPTWLPLVTLDAALWWADYYLARGVDPLETQEVRERLRPWLSHLNF